MQPNSSLNSKVGNDMLLIQKPLKILQPFCKGTRNYFLIAHFLPSTVLLCYALRLLSIPSLYYDLEGRGVHFLRSEKLTTFKKKKDVSWWRNGFFGLGLVRICLGHNYSDISHFWSFLWTACGIYIFIWGGGGQEIRGFLLSREESKHTLKCSNKIKVG